MNFIVYTVVQPSLQVNLKNFHPKPPAHPSSSHEEIYVCSTCHLEPEASLPQILSPEPALCHFSDIYLSHLVLASFTSPRIVMLLPYLSPLFSPIYLFSFTPIDSTIPLSQWTHYTWQPLSLFWVPIFYSLLTIVIHGILIFFIQLGNGI